MNVRHGVEEYDEDAKRLNNQRQARSEKRDEIARLAQYNYVR